jgi:hypothetical protein
MDLTISRVRKSLFKDKISLSLHDIRSKWIAPLRSAASFATNRSLKVNTVKVNDGQPPDGINICRLVYNHLGMSL